MLDYGFYHGDCMEYMKEFPDNYFDLAVCDPPYGDGLRAESGGKEWFTKYNQKVNPGSTPNMGGQPNQPKKLNSDSTVEAQNLMTHGTSTCTRTGGTLAAKYTKKS